MCLLVECIAFWRVGATQLAEIVTAPVDESSVGMQVLYTSVLLLGSTDFVVSFHKTT